MKLSGSDIGDQLLADPAAVRERPAPAVPVSGEAVTMSAERTEAENGEPTFVKAETLALDRPEAVGQAQAVANSADKQPDPDTELYDKEPLGAYEVAKALGVAIPDSREKILRNTQMCLSSVFRKLASPGEDQDMAWPMILSVAAEIRGIVEKDASIATIICRERVKKEPLVWHCLYTAILAMELAAYSQEETGVSVQDIGGAALLHDVGFVAMPGGWEAVRDEQTREFRRHVPESVALARRAGAPETVLTMIRHHHERLDGKGYPEGLQDDALPASSQIVALANVFEHAMIDAAGCLERDDSDIPGLSQVYAKCNGAYKTTLIKNMMALIGYYPIGSLVELSNRAIGEVAMQNRNMPLRPVVKILVDSAGRHPETLKLVDLKETRVLSVTRTLRAEGGRS